ncbi:hypothetical protein B6V73_11320 [Thioclava sp. JM3]|uniref:Acid-resistance membrane protein n=1 Tax=Thioclava nitratireducens TaxID=1915078 RepID=A0ABN4XBU2_9RHOB|nr:MULTISPECIES: DUF308 domain-containing protein [Thioclava]AQS46688.1 hypothetical protein BMG03_01860 [Thioclava nitratireducens]OWY16591.1 hypothetical protein B6V73_11320 [Thioclava sp. JM3]
MRVSTLFLMTGLVLIVLGVAAITNPFATSLALTTFVGILFLIAGVVQAWLAFNDRDGAHRAWHGLIALLNIVVGVWLIADPMSGTVSLAAVVGVLFLLMGALRLLIGLRLAAPRLRWMLVLSGAVSILLGLLIFAAFDQIATQILGLLLGIQLLADGVGLAALGFASRDS